METGEEKSQIFWCARVLRRGKGEGKKTNGGRR